MKFAIKQAVVPAAVMAWLAAIIFGTPDAISDMIFFSVGFTSAMVVLSAFWRLAPVKSWVRWKQRLATWLIAAGSTAVGCSAMLAPALFRR